LVKFSCCFKGIGPGEDYQVSYNVVELADYIATSQSSIEFSKKEGVQLIRSASGILVFPLDPSVRFVGTAKFFLKEDAEGNNSSERPEAGEFDFSRLAAALPEIGILFDHSGAKLVEQRKNDRDTAQRKMN
jgi:hypothetical protein